MPHGENDGEVHASALFVLGGEEFLDQLFVLGILGVQLARSAVLELRMVNALLGDNSASDEENTGDFEVGDGSEHAHLTEGVLSEAIETLHETFEQVSEDVVNLTFVAVLLVMEEPEGESFEVDIGHEFLVSLTSLVGVVHEVGLEVEKIEASGGQSIKWVDILLDGGVSGGLGLGTTGGGSTLSLLLLNLEDGLETLLGHLDLTEARDELGDGGNARKPGASLGGGLGEALVEDDLEGHGESASDKDVSNSHLASAKEVTSEARVDSAEVLLDGFDGVVEGGLGNLGVSSEDGHDGGVASLLWAGLDPVHPLVDLSALDGVGAEERSVAVSEVLGNGVGLGELALGALKKREFVGGVESLVGSFSAGLVRVDDELEGLLVHLGDDDAHVDEDVSSVLGVNFLLTNKDTVSHHLRGEKGVFSLLTICILFL